MSVFVSGLFGPGDRKSVGRMAERMVPGDYDPTPPFLWGKETKRHWSMALQAGRQAGRRRGCRVGHRRYGVAEKGYAFGWPTPRYRRHICTEIGPPVHSRASVPRYDGLNVRNLWAK